MKQFLKRKISTVFFVLTLILLTSCTHHQKEFGFHPNKSAIVEVDHGKLFYRKFGKGQPIIVVHGGPGLDQTYLQPQLISLSTKNEIIFYDQRGAGKSLETEINEENINIDKFVEDLEKLRKSLGVNKFILMGHSWGGLLSMKYATNYPDRLSALVLLNTAPADYNGQKAFIDEFGVRTKDIHEDIKPLFAFDDFKKLDENEISDVYRKLFATYIFDQNKIKDLNLSFNVTSAQSGFKVMEEMSKTSWLQPGIDLFPQLKKLNVPTLILHGKQDVVPAWTAKEIHKAIPNSEITILDECGHFPYIEKPKQFFDSLEKFLEQGEQKVS